MLTSKCMKPKQKVLSQVEVASLGAQKGTGRAPIFQPVLHNERRRKIHTPHMHSYVQTVPRKMRQAALRSALSVKATESMIIAVDALKVA